MATACSAVFAGAVGYHGPIWGYNRSRLSFRPSAYVEFHLVAPMTTCVIQIRAWKDGEGTKGAKSFVDRGDGKGRSRRLA